MEQYLTPLQIRRYPLHTKFKKISYGGSRVFIKEDITNKFGQNVECECYYYNGAWHMSSAERKRVQHHSVSTLRVRERILFLQNTLKKDPIDLLIDTEQYKKLYSRYSDADALGYYKKSSPEYIRVKDILSHIKSKSLVYDAGCNSGGIGRLLIQKKKCRVYGSELCESLGKKASEKGVNVFIGWAEQTPYKDEFFDYAILTFILEHVIDPRVLLNEALRVLKKNGTVLGHVPTAFGDWGEKTIGKHPEHLRAYSRKDLKKLLQESGLHGVQIRKEFLVGRRTADYYFFVGTK